MFCDRGGKRFSDRELPHRSLKATLTLTLAQVDMDPCEKRRSQARCGVGARKFMSSLSCFALLSQACKSLPQIPFAADVPCPFRREARYTPRILRGESVRPGNAGSEE